MLDLRMHKTITIPVVFQDKYILQMCGEKAFTKTFGNKKNEISKPFNIIRNDELHGLYQ
jgi:hypothetical protein